MSIKRCHVVRARLGGAFAEVHAACADVVVKKTSGQIELDIVDVSCRVCEADEGGLYLVWEGLPPDNRDGCSEMAFLKLSQGCDELYTGAAHNGCGMRKPNSPRGHTRGVIRTDCQRGCGN